MLPTARALLPHGIVSTMESPRDETNMVTSYELSSESR